MHHGHGRTCSHGGARATSFIFVLQGTCVTRCPDPPCCGTRRSSHTTVCNNGARGAARRRRRERLHSLQTQETRRSQRSRTPPHRPHGESRRPHVGLRADMSAYVPIRRPGLGGAAIRYAATSSARGAASALRVGRRQRRAGRVDGTGGRGPLQEVGVGEPSLPDPLSFFTILGIRHTEGCCLSHRGMLQ
jgi:hypothetical protein